MRMFSVANNSLAEAYYEGGSDKGADKGVFDVGEVYLMGGRRSGVGFNGKGEVC